MPQIKKASLKELDSLVRLFDNYRMFYNNASDVESAKLFLLDRLTNNDSEILIAIDEDTAVGFVQLYPLFSSTRMKKLWLLNDLYVEENFRGKGYSVSLIKRAKELCEATNACGLILETAKDNTIGNALYLKTGFRLDTEHNYYSWETNTSKLKP